ncbi:MAG TPA: hypothetical protein VF765_15230 [Polyangiaceae bacterium]
MRCVPWIAVSALLPLTVACGAGPDGTEQQATEQSDLGATTRVFHRSDTLSFGRAPSNTEDLSQVAGVADDFSNVDAAVNRAMAWVDQHPKDEKPLYLAGIHAWIYEEDGGYRSRIEDFASKLASRSHRTILLYFEEENASHPPHALSETHAPALKRLVEHATLLCATYANGALDRQETSARVAHWKSWYHDKLGVPLHAMWIDVDLSQTPSSFYYGSRSDLTEFDHVVPWALNAAYDDGFGGFHTYGNVGGKFGTKRAADSTYADLDDAWNKLVDEHPRVTFEGI